MNPTKQERHEIYILAKEIYKQEGIINLRGICVCVIRAWKRITINKLLSCEFPSFTYLVNTLFPEMAKIKPKKVDLGDDDYWWKVTNTKSRIAAFNKMIKMTENE